MIKKPIPLFTSNISLEAADAVANIIRSGMINRGIQAQEFEHMFTKMFKCPYAYSVNSCTSALRMAYNIIADLTPKWRKPPFEIITTPYTMVATNTAILECGIKPVFVDVKYETANIHPERIEDAITENTIAIVGVDYAGYPCLTSNAKLIFKYPNYVLGFNEIKQKVCWTKILGVTKRYYEYPLIKIRTEKSEVIVTPNHLILTDIGWIPACELTSERFIYKFHYNNIIEVDDNGKNMDLGTKGIIKGNISEGKFQNSDSKFISSIQLETNSASSQLSSIKGKESNALFKISNPNINRDRESIFGWNNRWRRNNLDVLSLSIKDVYSLYWSLQYKYSNNKICEKYRITSRYPNFLSRRLSSMLYSQIRGLQNRTFTESNNSIYSGQKKTSCIDVILLSKIFGLSNRNEKKQQKRFKDLSRNTKIEPFQIKSLEYVNEKQEVFDLITTTRNFFANNILVHNCEWHRINKIAYDFDLKVVQDAAQAIGAKYHKQEICNLTDVTCYSFQAIKHITTGNGGMFVTIAPDIAELANSKIWFGINKAQRISDELGSRPEDIKTLGFKYGMNDIAATMGIYQLKDLTRILQYRKAIAMQYQEELKGVKDLTLMQYDKEIEGANWMFPIHVERRSKFAKKMRDAGIEVAVHNWRNDQYSVFGGLQDLPNTTKLNNDLIHIPLHQNLTNEEVEYIISTIKGLKW